MDLSKPYEFLQPDKVLDRIHIIGCVAIGSTIGGDHLMQVLNIILSSLCWISFVGFLIYLLIEYVD